MEPTDKIAERFEKWSDKNWLSIEREISTFQKKVAETMTKLGTYDFVPFVDPCTSDELVLGDQLYLEIVRPKLYRMDFVPKEKKEAVKDPKKKSKEQDSDEEEQKDEQPVVVVEEKTTGKPARPPKKEKPKKAPKPKKEDLMKQKIIRETFSKQIDFVFNSFSMDKMQIDFGFRQKKLELKIATFFYIAAYVRKNKVKQQIDESLVFELINILIKVHRIFQNYEGKSFINSTQTIKISQRCMDDLRSCLDGLMEYYHYNIKSVITKYPKLVYYTIYDHFFPTLDIKPYTSQIEFVDIVKKALKKDTPTLIFYKTMIGSGKTTTSISLATLVNELKNVDPKKYEMLQLVYCCVIKSVRAQVGRLAYNERIRFALGAMDSLNNPKNLLSNTNDQKSIAAKEIADGKEYFPRVINSFSCSEVDIVDLVISDLHTTKEFLSESRINPLLKIRRQGKIDRENMILFIDEPTAFCAEDSKVTQKLFEILSEAPPKIIILASATMPDKDQLLMTTDLIKARNPGLEAFEVSSREFQIGCQFCSFDGEIIYPHSQVRNKQELEEMIALLSRNPFLMRLYTGPSMFTLLDRCRKAGLKNLPKLQNFLEIRQTDILRETMNMLNELKGQSDQTIEEVCRVDKQLENVANEEDEGSDEQVTFVKKGQYVNLKKLLKSDAYKFLGGCLIATEDPVNFAKTTFSKWIDGIPGIKKLLERYERDKKLLQERLDGVDEDKNMRPDEKMKKKSEIENQFEPKFDFPETKRINTMPHYTKYCKNKNPVHTSKLIRPIIIENVGMELFSEVEDWMIQLLFCGVAIYSKNETSTLYLNKVDDLAASGFLAYIICDESLCYGTNFPISNVILTDSLGDKLSINEMFQLIGRAGRVGQSWTARAFLEENGIDKLKDYIKTKDKSKFSSEATVFESFALKLLKESPLVFKSKRFSIIRSLRQPECIDIVFREATRSKGDEFGGKCLVDRICVVAVDKDGKYLTASVALKQKNSDANVEAKRFLYGRIKQSDLPRITTGLGESLDVALFYRDEPQFLRVTFNNAVKRIVKQTFGNDVPVALKNPFQYNNSVNFTNFITHSYAAVVTFESDKLKNTKGLEYSYNSIELAKNDIMLVNEHISKLLKQLKDEPNKESTSKTLTDVCSFYKSYHDFVQNLLPIDDEDSLYEHASDLQFANSPNFVIDRLCRPNWSKVELEAKK